MTLYSTNCVKCKILEQRLKAKGVSFDIVTDPQKIIDLGYQAAPLLEVNGTIMDFNEAISWVSQH